MALRRSLSRNRITTLLWIVAAAALSVVFACWTGLDFRLGPAYWNYRLSAAVGDEGVGTTYSLIGRCGGPDSYSFLAEHLAMQLQGSANDVVLHGIMKGICNTGNDNAEALLNRVFETNLDPERQYVAVLAAWGIQCLTGEPTEPSVPESIPEMYSAFGIGGFAPPSGRAEAEARFARLSVALRERNREM